MNVSAIAFIFAALFPGYLAYLEIIKKPVKWSKAILCLIFFCGFLGFGLYDILKKDIDAQAGQEKIISNTDSIGRIHDSTIRTIYPKIDSARTEIASTKQAFAKGQRQIADSNEAPLLDVFSLVNTPDPIVNSTANPDSVVLQLEVQNTREVEAYPITEFLNICKYEGNNVRVVSRIKRTPYNATSPIYLTKHHVAGSLKFISSFMFPTKGQNSTDTLYLCFGLTYKNKYGRVQKPIQKIYEFDVSKLDKVIVEEQNDRGVNLREWLNRNRYWQ